MAPDDRKPPLNPNTSEADPEQLRLALAQGQAYGHALEHMTTTVAHDGGEQEAGDYSVGYAVEEAEGMYEWVDGRLRWRDPNGENLHLEISVRDRSDGRFVPGVRVLATLIGPDGEEIGTHEQPLLWHPMIYHYGRNWAVPVDGRYTLRVNVEPPTFMRHDEVNGCRFIDPVQVEFTDVNVALGSD
jgi:Fe2+ transport protein